MKRISNKALSSLPFLSKKENSTHEYSPKENGDRVADQMRITFAESRHPVFRSTSPLSNVGKECETIAYLVSLYARRFGAGQWSFLGLGSEKMWSFFSEDSPQGEWDKMAEKMLTFAESGHPILRATSPLSRGQLKSKGGGKLSIHYAADQETITTVFHTMTSVNQLSFYGAVAEMCEYFETS